MRPCWQALHFNKLASVPLGILMSESSVTYSKTNIWIGLIWMLLASFLVAFTGTPYFSDNIISKEVPVLVQNVFIGFGLFIWLTEDAKRLEYKPHNAIKFFSLVVPELGVLLYCFSSRGAKKGFLQLGRVVPFVILCLLSMILAYEIFGYE